MCDVPVTAWRTSSAYTYDVHVHRSTESRGITISGLFNNDSNASALALPNVILHTDKKIVQLCSVVIKAPSLPSVGCLCVIK